MKSKNAENRPATDLACVVAQSQRNETFFHALAELYQRVDANLAQTENLCMGGGTCCRFDVAGHRLYVSSGELAFLLQKAPISIERCLKRRCPYQVNGLCHARAYRPLGCRIFFCKSDGNSRLYEYYHSEIRNLHSIHSIPYAYGELCSSILQNILE